MEKKLLITGFEPFGGQTVNPSWEAVRRLPEVISEFRLVKMEVPVLFGGAVRAVLKRAEEVRPDVILCVGQAGGRSKVTPEVAALNLRDARIADNAGFMPQGEPIEANGPAAYFATIPVRRIVDAVKEKGIPCELSYSAGVYVCNDLLYGLLYHYEGTGVQVGFIHVPYLPEQAGAGAADSRTSEEQAGAGTADSRTSEEQAGAGTADSRTSEEQAGAGAADSRTSAQQDAPAVREGRPVPCMSLETIIEALEGAVKACSAGDSKGGLL